MPARATTLDGQAMTAAERKRRQRDRQARGTEFATAEAVDAALLRAFRNQARYMSSGLVRRDTTIRELALYVVNEFPVEEREKVWNRLGLTPAT